MIKKRDLGKTGLQVSEIGFGSWQLGNSVWGKMGEATSLSLIQEALERGCNFFDTAPGYG